MQIPNLGLCTVRVKVSFESQSLRDLRISGTILVGRGDSNVFLKVSLMFGTVKAIRTVPDLSSFACSAALILRSGIHAARYCSNSNQHVQWYIGIIMVGRVRMRIWTWANSLLTTISTLLILWVSFEVQFRQLLRSLWVLSAMAATKIPAEAFYEEYHGHTVEHLRQLVKLVATVVKVGPRANTIKQVKCVKRTCWNQESVHWSTNSM